MNEAIKNPPYIRAIQAARKTEAQQADFGYSTTADNTHRASRCDYYFLRPSIFTSQ